MGGKGPPMEQPIRVEFEWSEAEFVEAQWKIYRAEHLRRAMVVYVAIFVAVQYVEFSQDWARLAARPPGTILAVLFGGALSLGLVALFFRLLRGWNYRSLFKRSGLSGVPCAYALDDGGIQISTPNSDGKLKWGLFERWYETPNVLLLRYGMLMYGIPKRALRAGDEERVKALLLDKVGPQGVSRKRSA